MSNIQTNANLKETTMDPIQSGSIPNIGHMQSKLWKNDILTLKSRVEYPTEPVIRELSFNVDHTLADFVRLLPPETKGMYSFVKYNVKHIFKIIAPYNCSGKWFVTWTPRIGPIFPTSIIEISPWRSIPENTFSCDITNDQMIEFTVPYLSAFPALWIEDTSDNAHTIIAKPVVGPRFGPGEKTVTVLHRVQFTDVEFGGYMGGTTMTDS